MNDRKTLTKGEKNSQGKNKITKKPLKKSLSNTKEKVKKNELTDMPERTGAVLNESKKKTPEKRKKRLFHQRVMLRSKRIIKAVCHK